MGARRADGDARCKPGTDDNTSAPDNSSPDLALLAAMAGLNGGQRPADTTARSGARDGAYGDADATGKVLAGSRAQGANLPGSNNSGAGTSTLATAGLSPLATPGSAPSASTTPGAPRSAVSATAARKASPVMSTSALQLSPGAAAGTTPQGLSGEAPVMASQIANPANMDSGFTLQALAAPLPGANLPGAPGALDSPALSSDTASGLDAAGGLLAGATLANPWATLAGTSAGAPTLRVTTPVASPAWGGEFGQALQVVVRAGIEQAQIRLNPEALGPVSVNLSMHAGQVSLVMTAAAAETRALIEAQMPQLREALGHSGLQLSDAQVQSGNPGAADPGRSGWQSAGGSSGEGRSDAGAKRSGSEADQGGRSAGSGTSDATSGRALIQGSDSLRRVDTFA